MTRFPRPRVVVLGASNVSRGLSRLVAAVESRSPGADLFVAAGHGRGYGVNTRVAARRLPSILRSGLWRGLDRHGGAAPVALVTDVGNELLYGLTAEQVASWVRESVRRLADRGATIAITRLPMAGIATVGAVRYRALRTFFVPGCRLSLADLKGDVSHFARQMMGPDGKVRFRPHFFPFTEPSVEYDFSCHVCGGKGCRVCKQSGWIEISGAGLVNPRVFQQVGIDADAWQGYAFGMGVERIAMILFGIGDIRNLYENDARFLAQFA